MVWASLNAVGLILALVLNGLAVNLPLNGMGTGELSDLYPNLFVPAGLTFSIWGVIYLWLIAFVGYGFARAGASDGDATHLEVIGPWFLVNCVANAAWIVAWHWMQVGVALALMLVLLGSLLVMYLRLGTGVLPASAGDRWLVRAPISVYLGWITVATIANVTALAVDLGAPSYATVPAMLTVGVLVVAVLLAGAVLWTRRDVAYALVVVWALLGIALKRSGATEDGSSLVAMVALGGLVVVGIGVVVAAIVRLRRSGGAAPAG